MRLQVKVLLPPRPYRQTLEFSESFLKSAKIESIIQKYFSVFSVALWFNYQRYFCRAGKISSSSRVS